jgi:hypothetical protein
MRKFGFELRKINSLTTKDLYEDIDRILSDNEIPTGGVTAEVQTDAIGHSLHKMFNSKSSFNVCTVRECAEISQIIISKERMDIYITIHCMDWSEMVENFRQQIVAMILDDFRSVLSPQEEKDIQTININ